MNETISALVTWKEETAQNMNHFYLVIMGILVYCKYYFLNFLKIFHLKGQVELLRSKTLVLI